MESKHQTSSVILQLMGLDKVPTQQPVRDEQKILSENYLQKVASIGVRKKRSSHQHHSFGMNTDEKEESEDVLKVVKAIRRDKHHNPSKGNGKEKPFLSGEKETDVHGEARLYETFGLSKSQLNPKDETFNSRISVLNGNPGNGGDGLKWFSFSGSCKNSHLSDGLLKEIFYPKSMSIYPEMRDRKKISTYHKNFGKISEEVSMETGNDANRVLDTVSEERNVTEKLQESGQCGQDSTHNQLAMIYEHRNEARNSSLQSGFSNDKIKRNIGYKVGVNCSFTRKVPRSLCSGSVISGNCGTTNMDNLFQKYWGLRKNACANLSIWKSKNQNINQKECSEDLNLSPGHEKFPSFSSYFSSNPNEENCIGHKSEKRWYMNDLSDEKPMPPQLSSSSPSPALIGSQNLQETCLMNDEVKNKKHEDSNMSKQDVMSFDSSIDCLVSEAMTEVGVRSHNNPTKQHSKSTAFIFSQGDIDSLSHSSYDSKQQDTSDFQEDSVHSLFSEGDPDSLGSFEEAYEPSPISVLDPSFREDILFSSKCGYGIYDSSEVDDVEFGLNVSSDEDCGNESEGDSEEKRDIAGLFRAEESRDFSYVVEVLTEAGISNRSLFTDFSTWHSAECPISPSVFEILEKKFGEQEHWKRSERRLLFDRINVGLLEILQPHMYIPMWEKPVSRRLNAEPSQDMIEEEMWGLLVAQEKKATKDSADTMLGGEVRWTELGENIEDIVREIVKLLIEELANEIVLENF